MELDKKYDWKEVEDKIYEAWEKSGYFAPEAHQPRADNPNEGKTYSIVLPPPNVTGTLHMGHAMYTVQDILIRYKRLKGFKTLWLPGTDHAATATSEKVEKEVYKKDKKNRHALGREEFLNRVEEFAQESHDTIVNQLKKMGFSLDWSREAYTLDEPRQRAVREAFKRMHEAGLIYRGKRIVNWDPKQQTTISDDEIVWKEQKSPFYYIKYGPFTIGTARPETKFGDKYVVMHPDDKRYKEYSHRQKIEVPWINKEGKIEATIIKDEAADPEFGTGVMTITPWHDLTDFEIAKRHNLDMEQIIDLKGKLLPVAGEFEGMHIKKARPLIAEKLKEMGLLEKVDENYENRIATADRGGELIEPQVMEQWFIDVNKKFEFKKADWIDNPPAGGQISIKEGEQVSLKELMKHVVEKGDIKITPKRFEKNYYHWIDNLRDWCISRQLWYGHRIPVWYDKKGGIHLPREQKFIFVRHGESEANEKGVLAGGAIDSPLTEKGKEQANEAAKKLKDLGISKIVSSEQSRAKESAKIIANVLGISDIEYIADLNEIDADEFSGKASEGKNVMVRAIESTEGESLEDIYKRSHRALDELKKLSSEGTILIVGHKSFTSAIFSAWNESSKDDYLEHRNNFEFKNGEFKELLMLQDLKGEELKQDPDTLDTWFSSGLWTFSTLGWPEITRDLKEFHPTSVMETGYDIIFFWVARMILMSGFLLGDVPFKDVYLHGLVRAGDGQKMSKSKGNGLDPLDMKEKYGADAARMSLIVANTPGNDMNLSEDKIKAYRNFTTKIWNASRFIMMNWDDSLDIWGAKLSQEDNKLLAEFDDLKKKVEKNIESFQLHLAAEELYHYFWHTFADIYIEEKKGAMQGQDKEAKASALRFLATLLREQLIMLHPFMPFVTEELYQKLPFEDKKDLLMIEEW